MDSDDRIGFAFDATSTPPQTVRQVLAVWRPKLECQADQLNMALVTGVPDGSTVGKLDGVCRNL